MRVLLTGAAGRIGVVVDAGLRAAGHEVVGVDRLAAPEGHGGDGHDGDWEILDCADPDAVGEVVGRHAPDAVVHLAGHPGEGSLADSLTSHTVTTVALLEAMVEHDVQRLVYASSNHAVGQTPRGDLTPASPLEVAVPGRPDSWYGVAKVAAEGAMSLYADRAGIDAVACRIGSFKPRPTSRRELATWLSHDDCVRMVLAALTTPAPGFAVLYGVSANTRGWWDLGPGRALGYQPLDDAERFADEVEARPDDDAQDSVVGGPFALGALRRPFGPDA